MLTGAVTQPSAGTFKSSDVTTVVASPSSGTKVAGNTITFTINTDLAFTVTGTPTLTLNDGGTATYTGGSGTNALTFSYTVAAAQNAVSTWRSRRSISTAPRSRTAAATPPTSPER